MSSIANLLVSLKTDFGSSDSALINFIAKLVQVGDEAEKTGEKVSEAGEKVEEMGHGSEGGGEALESLKDTFTDLGAEIVSFGAEALALTSVFEALKEAVEVSAEIESTQVALEALTGSAEKATEVIENMEKIAGSEALAFPEILPAAQHMIALGFSVEQTTEAMKATGNAAWALGEPLESVSHRLGMIAQSGRVSALFLRTLGLSTQDLGTVMGISAGEVSKAFQALSQTDRLEILIAALHKYGDTASKEAETVKGKWIELKNTWHEAFVAMGDDLSELTKGLETFVTLFGKAAAAIFQHLKLLPDSVKDLKKELNQEITKDVEGKTVIQIGAKVSDQTLKDLKSQVTDASKIGTLPGVIIPPKKEATEKTELQERVEKALGPLEAKEYAATRLEEIRGEEEANSRLAQLNREKTEAAIKAEHDRRQAEIDENENADARTLLSAQEEIRVAKEKQEKIGAIDAEEARRKAELLKARIGPEVARTYTVNANGVDEEARAAKIAEINQKLNNDLAKNADDLSLKQQKAADAVTAAISKQLIAESKITLGQTKTDRDIAGGKIKSDADVKSIQYQEQKIALEGEYDAQLSHTYEQQIAHLNAVAELERKSREAHIAGLQGELGNIPVANQDDAAQKKRADLENQIAKAKAEGAKDDADSAKRLTDADAAHLKAVRDVAEIKLKSDSDITAQKMDQQKLKTEADYAAQLSHTNDQEIAHLTQVAAIEEAQRQAKIQGLQAQLSQVLPGDDPELLKKRAELAAQIADSQEQSNTAVLQSAIQITQQMEQQNGLLLAQKEIAQTLATWSQIDLGTVAKDFADEIIKVPQGLGEAIATGLFDREKGKGIGQVMAKAILDSFKQEGKALAGTLATQGIEKLISVILGQNIFVSAQITATNANTTAIGLLIAAINANTTAQGGTPATTGGTPGGGTGGAGGSIGALATIFRKILGLPAVGPHPPGGGGTPPGIGSGNLLQQLVTTETQTNSLLTTLNQEITQLIQAIQQLITALAADKGGGKGSFWGSLLGGVLGGALGGILGGLGSGGGGGGGGSPDFTGGGGDEGNGGSPVLIYNGAPYGGGSDEGSTGGGSDEGSTGGGSDDGFPTDESESALFRSNIIPHGRSIYGLSPNTSNTSNTINSQANSTIGDMHFHIYGNNNPREIMRQIANNVKMITPRNSPANS